MRDLRRLRRETRDEGQLAAESLMALEGGDESASFRSVSRSSFESASRDEQSKVERTLAEATKKQLPMTVSSKPPADGNKFAEILREDEEQDANFVEDYQRMCQEFDRLVADQFKGEELEKLTNSFLDRHRLYLAQFVLEFAPEVRERLRGAARNTTDLSKLNENLEDDLRFISSLECRDEKHQTKDLRALLADVYRRAGQACYLRVTFNKCRMKREEDRREPVGWLQLAIRHGPNNFEACYWYMITVGRYSENITNARDRTLAGESFKQAILRCLKLRPNDPLSHHLLGRYYYHIANLNWIQRTLVRSFFNFKVEGTHEDAEREFRLAHSLKDDWLPVGLWMARVLLAQDKSREEIKHWIELALKMDVCEPSTEMERDELLELGRKLKVIQ